MNFVNHPAPDRVLSKAEYCDLRGISIQTADRMAKEGRGPRRLRISTRRVGYLLSDVVADLKAAGAAE